MDNVNRDELEELFYKQFGDLPVGGWINPELVNTFNDSDNLLEFRCHYNNFDNDDDSWHYIYNIKTKQFIAS